MIYLYSDSFIVVNVHQCHETDLNDILVPANFNNNKKHYDMANKQMQFNDLIHTYQRINQIGSDKPGTASNQNFTFLNHRHLPGPLSSEHRLNRVHKNFSVQPKTHVLDVMHIQRGFLAGIDPG